MFGRRTRGLWICMAAAMLIAGSAFTAYADTTIANIRVTFKIIMIKRKVRFWSQP